MNTWPRLRWRSAAPASGADLDQVSHLGSRLTGQLLRLEAHNMGTRGLCVYRHQSTRSTQVTCSSVATVKSF